MTRRCRPTEMDCVGMQKSHVKNNPGCSAGLLVLFSCTDTLLSIRC